MGFAIDSFPITHTASGSAGSATRAIAAFNAQRYRAGKLTLSGTWVGTVKVQGSYDGTTFHDIAMWSAASASPTLATSQTSTGNWFFNCIDTYLRVEVSAYTSGTVVATLEMSASPLPVPFSVTAGSAATVSGTEAHDAALSSAPVPIGGYAKTTAPSSVSADGDAVQAWFTRTGALNVADAGGSLTVDATGAAAHDAVASGAPVLIGGYGKTTAPTDVSADGDAVNLWCDLAGRLQVGDGGGTLTVDATGAAAHDAVASGAPLRIGAFAKATAPAAVSADGDVVNLWATTTGCLHVADGAGSLTVDATGAAAHDAAASGAPVLLGGYAKATAPSAVSADGDVANLWCTTTGELNIVGRGPAAHDAVASGAPLLNGAYAKTTAPSAVSADGDVANLWCDLTGKLQVGAHGFVAHDGVASGSNALRVGAKAQNALPSAVSADADACDLSCTQKGQLRVIVDADANVVGPTMYSNLALNATKAEVTDTANSRVYSIHMYNPSNAAAYLQIFDADADDVTVGSTTPTQVYGVATLGTISLTFNPPKKFATGLTVAATTTTTGSTNPSTACVLALDYIV